MFFFLYSSDFGSSLPRWHHPLFEHQHLSTAFRTRRVEWPAVQSRSSQPGGRGTNHHGNAVQKWPPCGGNRRQWGDAGFQCWRSLPTALPATSTTCESCQPSQRFVCGCKKEVVLHHMLYYLHPVALPSHNFRLSFYFLLKPLAVLISRSLSLSLSLPPPPPPPPHLTLLVFFFQFLVLGRARQLCQCL